MKLFNRTASPNGSGVAREIYELSDDDGRGVSTGLVVAHVRKRYLDSGDRDPRAEIELGELICEAANKADNIEKHMAAFKEILILIDPFAHTSDKIIGRIAKAAIAREEGASDA